MSEPAGLRSDARENRARVLRAAREVFGQRGVQAEMKDIAERAGVGVGTVYRNFATKEELIEAVIAEVTAEFEGALEKAEKLQDSREALHELFVGALAIVEQNGELVAALLEAGYHEAPESNPTMERARRVMESGVAAGAIRGDVPIAVLIDFVNVSMPLVYWHLRQRWGQEEAGRYCEVMLMSALTGEQWQPPTA